MTESAAPLVVRSLICHRDVEMAVACLGSLLRLSADAVRLALHDDGSLTIEDTERLQNELAGATIILRAQADDVVNPLLSRYPHCARFRRENIFGLKLLDIPLASDGDLAYCDSDILFLRPYDGLFRWPGAGTSAIFMMDTIEPYSVRPRHLLGAGGLKLASKVNAGLIFLRHGAYDLDFIEWFLGHDEYKRVPPLVEQTCWAALGHRVGCRFYDPKQIAMMRPGKRLADGLIAGHFIRRYRFLLKDFLVPAADAVRAKPLAAVRTVAAQECSYFSLSRSLTRAQLGVWREQVLSIFGAWQRA
jgi:hypothetical protein